jgi:hypothetical protein
MAFVDDTHAALGPSLKSKLFVNVTLLANRETVEMDGDRRTNLNTVLRSAVLYEPYP